MTPFLIAAALVIVAFLIFKGKPGFGPDQPYKARNGLWVAHAVAEDADIEVYSAPGAAGPAYFCAAADFAVRHLKSSRGDYLVVAQPEADSETRAGFRSVHFRITGKDAVTGLPPNGAVVSVSRSGEHRTIAFAEQLC